MGVEVAPVELGDLAASELGVGHEMQRREQPKMPDSAKVGQVELDDLLVKRDSINQQLQKIIDELTNPWGIKVTLVEVKDVELAESMRRAMGRQAEAERERRSKVIHAIGEKEAAQSLGEAAAILDVHPAAMQLRVLSTMVEVSAEKNSTLIFPIPVELLRLIDTMNERNRPGRADE